MLNIFLILTLVREDLWLASISRITLMVSGAPGAEEVILGDISKLPEIE